MREKSRGILLHILNTYEDSVCNGGMAAVWVYDLECERKNLNRVRHDIEAYAKYEVPFPQKTLQFLRFAEDMNLAKVGPTLVDTAEEEYGMVDELITSLGGVNVRQNLTFDDGFSVLVEASCLIEDIQALVEAVQSPMILDKVNTTTECLSELLCHATKRVNSRSHVVPSPSSVIAPGTASGIMCFKDGSDIPCAAWKPVSLAMSGGCVQCPDNCPYRGESIFGQPNMEICQPGEGCFKLFNGMVYNGQNGEDVLMALNCEEA